MNKFRSEQAKMARDALEEERARRQPEKMTISFDEYERMVKMLCIKIRKRMEKSPEIRGVKQSDIVNWYVEKQLEQI
jgi:hypothetical protein